MNRESEKNFRIFVGLPFDLAPLTGIRKFFSLSRFIIRKVNVFSLGFLFRIVLVAT
jgi:hypothetical protein